MRQAIEDGGEGVGTDKSGSSSLTLKFQSREK